MERGTIALWKMYSIFYSGVGLREDCETAIKIHRRIYRRREVL
jgi:hypothetical protein